MKKWITLSIGAIVFLTSCDKDALDTANSNSVTEASAAGNSGISSRAASSSSSIYVSDWKQMSSWNSYDSASFRIYYNNMSDANITGDVIANGAVVAFGKVNVSAQEYQQFNDPMMLPFYFVGTNGRPVKNAFYFSDQYTPGNARISYSTMAMDGSMPAGVSLNQFQFRYFIVPASFMAEHDLTADMLRSNYTYTQMLTLAGLKE